jgi:hypothetical protein
MTIRKNMLAIIKNNILPISGESMGISQKAYGSHNNQITQIFNRPLDPVDICADKIGSILRMIADVDFSQPPSVRLTPPDINLKNIRNLIDEANAIEIEKTYALWDEITSSITVDASGSIASDYTKAAFILNQLYLAKFQNNFPDFKLHASSIYFQSVSASSDDIYLLIHLIHYMYLSCQVGIKP